MKSPFLLIAVSFVLNTSNAQGIDPDAPTVDSVQDKVIHL
jgi:hypothetical protein